ncbi:MAG: hypothetical protein NC388_06035 [Clostridium sp.]|nr:hypothetical protein [Clostridium sp.]
MMLKHVLRYILCGLLVMLAGACSTKKNTSGTRFYHALTARFNTYYNGSVAFKDGLLAQEQGHKDDYTRLLPMYISSNKTTGGLGKSNYETAITKCEKAIKRHSIKRRPKVNVSKRKTEKDKAYLARKEFNPFLKNAWLLMGRSQFQQGQFIEAASTFNYIARLYATQPEVLSVARAYLARCYVELDWPYDAEDVFGKISRDSITSRGRVEQEASYADYLIGVKRYEEAIPYLQRTIKKEKRKKQRARLNYLMGQLYELTDNPQMAYKAFQKVIRSNPPYELELNARVQQSQVMAGGQHRKMIKKLQRMARNDKNKDYQDYLYYAIGNIYLAQHDTMHCIGAYETGVEKSTQNGIAKAVVLLHLGQIYWERENYIEAQRCYSQLLAILDKEHEEYAESERRSKILDELEPHLSAVKLQDSLQWLARLPENQRNEAIDRVIEALKKKEKEEAKKAAAEETASGGNDSGQTGTVEAKPRTPQAAQTGQQGAWYFYNPMVVNQGKNEFRRRWGKRPLEDNWRRSNKEVVSTEEFGEYNYDEDDEQAAARLDSIAAAEEAEADRLLQDSLANDPHERAYYLAQIPFEEDQLQASHQVLADGLYHAGVLEMERLENFPLAYRTLLRLLTDYPGFGEMADVYYHLFLLTGRFGRTDEAELYRQKVVDEYPESKLACLLGNPRYALYARHGKHIEDSVYAATYQAYQENRYDEVERNYEWSTSDFPEGIHRPKFMFIHAMSRLYSGDRAGFLEALKEVIEKYPKSEVTEMADYIVKGIKDGKLLSDSKYDAGNIWARRSMEELGDSTAQRDTLSRERYTDFVFMLAFVENSLDEDQLLYEVARYNFTSFLVRNFDIEIVKEHGLGRLLIRGFLSFDEVHAYTQKLFSDPRMAEILKGIRVVMVSEENLRLLGSAFSFDDYKAFFDEHFAPLEISGDLMLDEPTEIKEQPENRQEQTDVEQPEFSDDERFLFE